MKKASISALAVLLLVSVSVTGRADYVDKKIIFSRNNAQIHIWGSAGATAAGFGLGTLTGMSKPAALGTSSLLVLGTGLAKEYVMDDHPSVNDLTADGLGILLGALLAVVLPLGGEKEAPPRAGLVPTSSPLHLADLPSSSYASPHHF